MKLDAARQEIAMTHPTPDNASPRPTRHAPPLDQVRHLISRYRWFDTRPVTPSSGAREPDAGKERTVRGRTA
jgi:hypothetical protein